MATNDLNSNKRKMENDVEDKKNTSRGKTSRQKRNNNKKKHNEPSKNEFKSMKELTVYVSKIPRGAHPTTKLPYMREIKESTHITFISPGGLRFGRLHLWKANEEYSNKVAVPCGVKLLSSKAKCWKRKKDRRRGADRAFFINGSQIEQGRYTKKGPAVFCPTRLTEEDTAYLNEATNKVKNKVVRFIKYCRPVECEHIAHSFQDSGTVPPHGGIFMLEMGAIGTTANSHVDYDDFISVMTCVANEGEGGQLCIAGTNIMIDMQPGDIIICDTDVLSHGNLDWIARDVVIDDSTGERLSQEVVNKWREAVRQQIQQDQQVESTTIEGWYDEEEELEDVVSVKTEYGSRVMLIYVTHRKAMNTAIQQKSWKYYYEMLKNNHEN